MSYSLRDLPLPVKVVVTVFLLAVGAGYTSALLQLHIQDSKSGKPMPTVDDVVLKFTGKKRHDPNAPPLAAPVSRLESLVTSDVADITGATMAGAFTEHDRSPKALKFSEQIKSRPKADVLAERKGEQAVFALWIRTPEKDRKAAYDADRFAPPADKTPVAFTAGLKDGSAVKIKTLIAVRCVTCHAKDGEKPDPDLSTYEGLAAFMPAAVAPPKAVNGWVKVEEPISISKLTQSTHAHLLSFAVLFSLTGLIFAFSSLPAWIRTIGGPSVVVAVFADVALWWLARLCDDMGPYFAMGVIVTGGVAGLGLMLQITGSLFSMYGWGGRFVLALLVALGLAGGAYFVTQLLVPALPKPKAEKMENRVEPKAADKKDTTPPAGGALADAIRGAGVAVADGARKAQPVAATGRKPANELDRLLTWPPVDAEGRPVDPEGLKFKGGDDGTMVPAFFEKDKKYAEAVKAAPPAERDRLKAQRQGDLDAMVAWVRSPDAVRKSTYEADAFDVPGLSDKALTPDFVKGGKVRIKALIDARCATCHSPCNKQADYPLTSYKELAGYLAPNEPEPAPKPEPKAEDKDKSTEPVMPKEPLPVAPAPRPIRGPVGKDE
ncbi:MAG: hypothetical protein K2V38_17090 [Gemmataceae bacterium]|nr:hypothetical protein [Gemmataceae bacterium]